MRTNETRFSPRYVPRVHELLEETLLMRIHNLRPWLRILYEFLRGAGEGTVNSANTSSPNRAGLWLTFAERISRIPKNPTRSMYLVKRFTSLRALRMSRSYIRTRSPFHGCALSRTYIAGLASHSLTLTNSGKRRATSQGLNKLCVNYLPTRWSNNISFVSCYQAPIWTVSRKLFLIKWIVI